jgi:hypothetical protein
MSLEAYDDFIYQLEGLKRRVYRAVKKDAQPPETVAPQPPDTPPA